MKQFLKQVFSEPDGTPSFSRVATALLVAFACGWVTAVVRDTHALPLGLGELAFFVGSLYGANKLAWGIKKGDGSQQ